MWLYLISLVLILSLLKFYLWSQNKYKYWSKKGIKGPRPVIPFGNFKDLALLKERIELIAQDYYDSYPNESFVGLYFGFKPLLLVRKPEDIKQILIKDFKSFPSRGLPAVILDENSLFTSEGHNWNAMRKFLNAGFGTTKLKMLDELMQKLFEDYSKWVDKLLENSTVQDINDITCRSSLALTVYWLFGIEVESFGKSEEIFSKFYYITNRIMNPTFTVIVRMVLNMLIPYFEKTIQYLGFKEHDHIVNNFFYDLFAKIYEKRKGSDTKKNDFMNLMCELKDQRRLVATEQNKESVLEIDNKVIAIQLGTLFGASHEVALQLSIIFHELAFQQNIQEKAYNQIKNVMQKHNGLITYDSVQEMTYLEMIFHEALRRGSTPLIRLAAEDFTFPKTNLKIDKGTYIMMPTSALHMDPQYFDNPDVFDPERFSFENRSKIPPGVFLPFGDGPRNCIGRRLVKFFTMAACAMFLSRFKVEPSENSTRYFVWDTTYFAKKPTTKVWLKELLPLEIRLEITARETLHAIRAILLHTHWHSFTLLAEEDIYLTLSLRKDLSSILTGQPLNPQWLSLPKNYSRHALFRRLAEISRLTRGVVVLICDIHYAKLVMDEAKRLNMLEGHFFWIWIDATRKIDVFRNISNKTHFDDADPEFDRLRDEDIALTEDRSERNKRDDADNKIINILKINQQDSTVNLDKSAVKENLGNAEGVNVKNSSMNSSFRRTSRNLSKTESHSVNDKLYVNYSQSFDKSRNISSKNIRNVHKKGVETSKIENHSIEKERNSLLVRDNNRRNSNSRLRNESFNKYVNSINENNANNANKKDSNSNQKPSDVRNDLLFSSDISNFLMNPTVHTSTLHNIRENLQKRKASHYTQAKHNHEEPSMTDNVTEIFNSLPVGLLALHPQTMQIDRVFVREAVRMTVGALRRVLRACDAWSAQAQFFTDAVASCWEETSDSSADFSAEFVREMRLSSAAALSGGTERPERALTATFALLNLVPGSDGAKAWRQVGQVLGRSVSLHTIVWPGGRLVAHGQSSGARTIFRIVTALAPPFVMEGELDEDGQCLRGIPCHRPQSSDKDNLTLAFNDLERETDDTDFFFPTPKPTTFSRITTHCCYGLAMDLLENIAQELEFDFHLYIVEDGMYGARKLVRPFRRFHEYRPAVNEAPVDQQSYRSQYRNGYKALDEIDGSDYIEEELDEELEKWNGVIGDLVSGAAHMSFAALSVSSARAEVIDYSQPYFFSGVSLLAAPNQKADIPLLAFLLPFSPELWIAIFTSLNVTAIAVAIYEWLSPFGLNPWGRQRSKNFSISSALWVMWGLLCGHLVAFKAPKSWPNKFLINVWGGFSVIFVASYTANIAALIAGLFFHNAVDDFHGKSNWLSLRVGTAKASVSEYYVQRNNPPLAEQMRRNMLQDIEEGIQRLRNGTLDLLIADTPVLDYYRATDHGCKLQRIGDHALAEDTYAIGMTKGFPLKDSISAVIAKYSSNGYMDILTEKWYGGLPCFKLSPDYGIQPKPLGVAAVAGVFILLGVGMVVGCLILMLEHLFYKYTLPVLRHQPKGTIWRSRNIMFFSQKLYRFINTVELVSPHHAARELVHTIRQGHFTSLFQKSVKRKEHEQRRRRKSKAQFFEMIQEIRRVQQREQSLDSIKEHVTVETSELSEDTTEMKYLSPSPDVSSRSPRQGRSPRQLRSPRNRRKRCSLAGLNVRRFSTDSVLGSDSGSIYERTCHNIGRRLSRDVSCLTSSPPDINTRLRSPSPMVRRAEGSSTRSYQDVSERSEVTHPLSDSRASVEILVSHPSDTPPLPPYPRAIPSAPRADASRASEEELIRLWRGSGREVRDTLLASLQERQTSLDPDQDPG